MAYTIRDYTNDFYKAASRTLKEVDDWVRSARVLPDGTIFNSQSFTLNNYADIETRFENLFEELQSLKDDDERDDLFWFLCYGLCQQLILFYGEDKPGHEGYSKPNELNDHKKFAFKIKQYLAPCDVLSLSALPDMNTPQLWPIKSDSAYIVVGGKLYHIIKGVATPREIALSQEQFCHFNEVFKPNDEYRTLTRKESRYIHAEIDIDKDNQSLLQKIYKDLIGIIKMATKVSAVKSKLGLINVWRGFFGFFCFFFFFGLNYFLEGHLPEKLEDLFGKKFDEAAFIREMEAPNFVSNVLSVGLFAARLFLNVAELIRHVCLPHGGRVGLLSMDNSPLTASFAEIEKFLDGRDAVILFNQELYYADRKKREVYQVEITERNTKSADQLQLKFTNQYQIADDKAQALIVSVTGRKPAGGEKDSTWTERFLFEIYKRNSVYLNDAAWSMVNLFTNYTPLLFDLSAPLVNWLIAGFLGFDFIVILWQRFWAEREYHRMRDHYDLECRDYRRRQVQLPNEISRLVSEVDELINEVNRKKQLSDDLSNAETYVLEGYERMRQELDEALAAKQKELADKEQELKRLPQLIASNILDRRNNELKWTVKNSTFWFNAGAAALFVIGFTSSFFFAAPIVAIVAYAACIVAVAMYLSGGAYSKWQEKSLRSADAHRDYEDVKNKNGRVGPGLQYIQCKNDSLRDYQATRRGFWLTMARNVLIPTVMIALIAACWQAAVVFAALYVGYKLYQHYHKPNKAPEKLKEIPSHPGFFATKAIPASGSLSDDPSTDNHRVENEPDVVRGLVPVF